LHNLGVLSLEDADEVAYDEGGPVEADADPTLRKVDPWASFEASRFHGVKADMAEAAFEITIDGRALRGKVDAVYADGTAWEIVDYKSGSPKDSDALDVQLQAYAVAASKGALSEHPPSDLTVTFAYFGTDPATEMSQPVDDTWLARANARLGELLTQGESGPFPPSPADECRWCDFLHHCDAGKAYLAGNG
jgi:RecB family exonuclease